MTEYMPSYGWLLAFTLLDLVSNFLYDRSVFFLTNNMLSCLGLWFHSDIELLLFQGLYFINKNTMHRMEQQVSIVWELLYLYYSCSHLFFLESSYWWCSFLIVKQMVIHLSALFSTSLQIVFKFLTCCKWLHSTIRDGFMFSMSELASQLWNNEI